MVHIYVGVHEVGTELCRPDLHCFSCQHDEEGPTYVACGECFHLYPTARALRKAARAAASNALRAQWGWSTWRPAPDWPSRFDLLGSWLLSRFPRAARVYSCPLCTHDF